MRRSTARTAPRARGREGFDDVVVGAELESEDTVDLGDAAGQQDHRHVRACADRRQHLEAAAGGQVHVENDEAGAIAGEPFERGGAVRDVADVEALAFQPVPYETADDRVVVDDEHAIPLGQPAHHVGHLRYPESSAARPVYETTIFRQGLNSPRTGRRFPFGESVEGVADLHGGGQHRMSGQAQTAGPVGARPGPRALEVRRSKPHVPVDERRAGGGPRRIGAVGAAEPAGAAVATFTMSPAAGPPGTVVHVRGRGCAPGVLGSRTANFVTVTATTLDVAFRAPVAADGSWSGAFTVPESGAPGSSTPVEAACVSSNVLSLTTVYTPKAFSRHGFTGYDPTGTADDG